MLLTLSQAPGRDVRVADLVEALAWEKSRVSHQLTRMENRGFVEQTESGASGRRTRIGLTTEGRHVAQNAILAHGGTIRRHFLDALTPEQATAFRAWSEQVVNRFEPRGGEIPDEG